MAFDILLQVDDLNKKAEVTLPDKDQTIKVVEMYTAPEEFYPKPARDIPELCGQNRYL